MKLLASLIFLFFILSINVFSQENAINEYTSIRYDKSFQGGILKLSNGLGFSVQYKVQRKSSIFLFNLDIYNLKHPKESRVVNPIEDAALPYVYGKIFSAIPVHFGFGNEFLIADKEVPNGIRIGFLYNIGIDMALLKPQYLWINYYYPEIGKIQRLERYDPENPIHANQNNIFGGSSFYHGLSSMESVFGTFAKVAFNFEWNKEEYSYKTLETGVLIDAFPEPLPIFGFIQNSKIFLNIYLALNFGKRW